MRKKIYQLLSVLLTVTMLCGILPSGTVFAATESASLTLLATSDLHGQVNPYNYYTSTADTTIGLASLATIIKNERTQNPGQTMLFDCGDAIYDYTTDYFYESTPNQVQPIYSAMAALGYDYLTVGNHEFDYGYPYMLSQLKAAGLLDKTLCANVSYLESGALLFTASAISEKTLTTENGTQIKVKVGVVGATVPKISAKAFTTKYILKSESVVTAVSREAKALKAQGADIVVAMVHNGLSDTSKPDENACAEIAKKVPEVDAILGGHSHTMYPDAAASASVISGGSSASYLVNGKPIAIPRESGRSLAKIELTINSSKKVTGVKVCNCVLGNGKDNTFKVTADTQITSIYAAADKKLRSLGKKNDIAIENENVITNHFTRMQDSEIMQLLNDAKIDYARSFVARNLTSKAKLPIIACSTTKRYDRYDRDAYINFSGSIDQTAFALMQDYEAYMGLYQITGANLKRWLEDIASIYGTIGSNEYHYAPSAGRYRDAHQLSDFIGFKSGQLYDWSKFYVFDGVDYTFDLSKPIGARVTSLTVNGKAVAASDKLLLSCEIPNASLITKYGLGTSLCTDSYLSTEQVVRDYIKRQAQTGHFAMTADNNWNWTSPAKYFVSLNIGANSYLSQLACFDEIIVNDSANTELLLFAASAKELPREPHVLLTPSRSDVYRDPVTVYITASAGSALQSVCYLTGDVTDPDDEKWASATAVSLNKMSFSVKKNGTYSVKLTDKSGLSTTAQIVIDEINAKILPAPQIAPIFNRMNNISGTAVANSTVTLKTPDGKKYTAKADAKGKFTMNIPAVNAFETVSYMCTKGTLKSAVVKMVVQRSGPDAPVIAKTAKGKYAYAKLPQGTVGVVVIYSTKTVYVPKAYVSKFKKCQSYSNYAGFTIKYCTNSTKKGVTTIKLADSIKSGYKYAVIALGNYKATTTLYGSSAPTQAKFG